MAAVHHDQDVIPFDLSFTPITNYNKQDRKGTKTAKFAAHPELIFEEGVSYEDWSDRECILSQEMPQKEVEKLTRRIERFLRFQ